MNLFEIREKEIFTILKNLHEQDFVLIGGYAVNTYTIPRFSVDCDIVVMGKEKLSEIGKILVENKYILREVDKTASGYYGEFVRYEKELAYQFKVSMDILVNAVLDRRSNATFAASWVFENSEKRILRGKTINEEISLRIINSNALIAMKTVACRSTDIRDVFMLIVHVDNFAWIQQEIQKKVDFKSYAKMIREKICSSAFKNNLQGVYGYVDEKMFEKHQKKILEFCKI